jgi:single-strand DNA-binding protein
MNNASLVGNLATEVTTREAGEATVGNFLLAVSRPMSKEDREAAEAAGKPTADFIRVTVWNGQAKSCEQYLSKGNKVAVEGSLRSSTYTKDDEQRYSLEVNAQRVEFLTPRNGNGAPQADADAEAAAVASGPTSSAQRTVLKEGVPPLANRDKAGRKANPRPSVTFSPTVPSVRLCSISPLRRAFRVSAGG